MDSSRAWLTVVADNNDEGDDDYNNDEEGLRADCWLSPRAHPAARETFKYSCKKTKQKKRTKNGNSNVLKLAKVECDVSIFTNLKLSFLVVVFFHVFILILLSLLWCIFGFLEGEDKGFKKLENWVGWAICKLGLHSLSMIPRKISIE